MLRYFYNNQETGKVTSIALFLDKEEYQKYRSHYTTNLVLNMAHQIGTISLNMGSLFNGLSSIPSLTDTGFEIFDICTYIKQHDTIAVVTEDAKRMPPQNEEYALFSYAEFAEFARTSIQELTDAIIEQQL